MRLSDYNDARRTPLPFADADPALLLNLDFRDRAAAEATLAANSATLSGSGHLWDSEKGFSPNLVSGYRIINWVPVGHASRAAAFASGECTVLIELERNAVATSWLDDGNFFVDSGHGLSTECWDGSTVTPADHPYGDYTASTKLGRAFHISAGAGTRNLSCMYQLTNSSGNPLARLVLSSRDNNSESSITIRPRGAVPDLDCFDPDFMQLVYTIVGTRVHIYVDGHLIRVRELTEGDFVTLDMFYNLSIGSQVATTNPFRGYIRRFQIANKASMVREGPRIAFIGDSFVQRGGGHATPNSANPSLATVAHVDAVQNGLYESSLVTTSVATENTIIGAHWRPWIHELARVSANYALPFQFYCAGNSGRGWATTGATGGLSPYFQAFIDAVVAYDPEIIVATGSLNDVHGTNTADSYLADAKAKIDELIQGSHNVRKFYFFETWPGYKGSSAHAVQSYINEYHRQRALQAELDGYTVTNADGIDVAVKFVPVYEKIGGDNHSANYTEGGSEYAALWDAVFTKTKTMNDLHPGQVGMDMMVKVYWEAISQDFLSPVIG